MEVLEDALCMRLDDIFGYTFHPEDFDVESCAIRESIVDGAEILLVNLAHVHAEAASGVKSSTTTFTFEVLRFLVVDEDL